MILRSSKDGEIVAFCCHASQVQTERENMSDPTQILQSSCKRLGAGRTFKAHEHLPVRRETVGTQEAWVVISGVVRATVFDLDGALLTSFLLEAGDCLVTFRGGHAMEVVEDAILYEFKNGPYLSQEVDKRWLG
jgi:hypothetical protein